MVETVAAKSLETEAVVQWWWKQREYLCVGYVGSGQWKQRGSGDGGKKVVVVAVEEIGRGQWFWHW